MKRYCNEVMLLDDDEVSAMPWDVFVRTIADRDRTLLTYNGTTWQHLVMIITRKKNYMVGLYNQRLINVSVPWFPSWRNVTSIFEWSFSFATRDLWTELGEVNPDYISGDYHTSVAKLRKSFMQTGILGLVLAPVILIVMIIYALITMLDEIRNSPGVIFSRQWSSLAKWRLRCFDEVDCCLEDRLAMASPKARSYVAQFKNPIIITFGKLATWMLLTLLVPFILLPFFMSNDVLNYMVWQGSWTKSVLVVTGVVASALTVARGLVPADDFVSDPQKYMKEMLEFIRLPPLPRQREMGFDTQYEWIRDAHSPFVQGRFTGYFKAKGLSFLSECSAVLTVPFIMMYSLYAEAGEIVQFLKDHTVPMGPGLGTKFLHSGLDSIDQIRVEETARPHFPPSVSLASPLLAEETQGVRPIQRALPLQWLPKPSNSMPLDRSLIFRDKVEESILTFKGYYPHWSPASSASADILTSGTVHHYGSTAYRPNPEQIAESDLVSYLGRRRHGSERPTPASSTASAPWRPAAYPTTSSGTYFPPRHSHHGQSLIESEENDDHVVELEPSVDQRPQRRTRSTTRPAELAASSSAASSSSSGPSQPRGDDIV